MVDKSELVPELLKVGGLVREHLNSYDYFVTKGIKKIVNSNNRITASEDESTYLEYKDVRIGKPSITRDYIEILSPHMCRLAGMTYAADILVDIEYVRGNNGNCHIASKNNVVIGKMPVMIRSCCFVLYGKDEPELARLGECPLDPGGYFVVQGTEKVILIQEKQLNNRIMTGVDEMGNYLASVTSSTATRRSETVFVMERGFIYLQMDQFQSKVPIIVVMKALGLESVDEVMQMVGERYHDLLKPSVAECLHLKVNTKKDALKYLGMEVKMSPYVNASAKQGKKALEILRDIFLAHVPIRGNSFREKGIYAVLMLRHILDASLGRSLNTAVDDKNFVGNKRFELSGQLISMLFEDLFKAMNKEIKMKVDKIIAKGHRSRFFDFSMHIDKEKITKGLERALSTGCFGVGRNGFSQVLARESFIGAMGHMTKVSPQFEKSCNDREPRALHPSQWGVLCPCDTTSGEACGLVKHMALMTRITPYEDEGHEAQLEYLCYELGVETLEDLTGLGDSFLVIFNELILGKHARPQLFANGLRKFRRSGRIGKFVNVFINPVQRCVFVTSGGGRLCRPLIIADKGVARIKQDHMAKLSDRKWTIDDFLRQGLIEYLDVDEENDAQIALYENQATTKTTHIEIQPFAILGVCAGSIPFLHHNPSPRNTYQCAMGKQAVGSIAYNQLTRMDALLNLLVYPQRPLVTTKTIELVGYDKLGGGQNATVAIMSSACGTGDAIVMNRSSLDRGFGRSIVMRKKTKNLLKTALCREREEHSAEEMQALDDDGIASPGQIIRSNDILINKSYSTESGVGRRPIRIRHFKHAGQTTVVERVALCSDRDNFHDTVKLIIRETRRPEVGDKFSDRHGQKGVCATIVQQEDLPFTEQGISPDLIINPHGAVNVGKLIELVGGKAGVSCGKFHYGTAFGDKSGHPDTVEAFCEKLVNSGFSYTGKDFIYSGESGNPVGAYVFMGPVYYQKSKHMVLDKMHARSFGLRDYLTREQIVGWDPTLYGGARVGEMERDCMIAYGASMLINERMMLSSDPYEAQVCRECGLLGYYDHKLKTAVCSTCKISGENVSKLKMPYAFKLLIQELQSMNIVLRLKLADA